MHAQQADATDAIRQMAISRLRELESALTAHGLAVRVEKAYWSLVVKNKAAAPDDPHDPLTVAYGPVSLSQRVNPRQASTLLKSVGAQKRSGALMLPFFATLYFAGLRPEEAVNLRKNDLTLPSETGVWGEIHLSRATPDAGRRWTDSGEQRDDRGLKHRAEGDTRIVPCAPELVAILRTHLDANGTGPENRVFHGEHGAVLATSTIQRVWRKARETALSKEEQASPLAKWPYDLRHACLSTWLNAGVPAKTGGRLGGQQRRSPLEYIRQMPRGPGRDLQATHR